MEYIKLAAAGLLAVGGVLVAGYLAYTGLRDAFCPEKSRLAQSIRDQLPYPEEAPPVKELFAMVDEDLCRNGQWFGKLAVGSEWVLGDEAVMISHIRGAFWQDQIRTRRSGNRVSTTRILELWILDNRQQCHSTAFRLPKRAAGRGGMPAPSGFRPLCSGNTIPGNTTTAFMPTSSSGISWSRNMSAARHSWSRGAGEPFCRAAI